MDNEKFDQHLMGFLFDELDEVTHAAMKRKIESDADCRELAAGLRATLEVAHLPLEDPSDDLEERILAATTLAQQGEPWHRKLLQSLSWAGSWAMRPQLAMAALLMLVIGSSVLLMRAKPGSVAVIPSKDAPTAAGDAPPAAAAEPEQAAAEPAEVAMNDEASPQAAATTAPSQAASAATNAQAVASFDDAMTHYREGRFGDAQRDFNSVASSGGPKSASAALFEAKSARAMKGCAAAVPLYQSVRARFAGGAPAADATYELGDCMRQLGKTDEAMKLWASLADNEDYKERVAHEMSNDGDVGTTGGSAVASKRRMAAAPRPAAKPKAKAKPAPAAPPPAGGSGGKAKASAPDEMNSLGL
jgi:TolA-binding protein